MATGDLYAVGTITFPDYLFTIVNLDAGLVGTFDLAELSGTFRAVSLAGTIDPLELVGTFDVSELAGIIDPLDMEGTFG